MIDIRIQVLTLLMMALFVMTAFINPALAQEAPSASPRFEIGANFPFGNLLEQFFGKKYSFDLEGSQEVLGGDIDGVGKAEVRIDESTSEICSKVEANYIEQATSAQIHYAPRGSTGVVVVNLPVLDAWGRAEGCAEVETGLLKKINENPQDYYVNIYTNPYPDGAIRGQLFN